MARTALPSDAGVAPGLVILGKYRVDRILGRGAMGVVAKCTHLALDEPVALKMLRRDVLEDPDAVGRFVREAQSASKLRSEHVARVADVGESEAGTPFMVMEFLDGHNLGELLEERGRLPAPWAVELVVQTAEALAEAHALGIVHRDVKPTNLFVTWRPDGSALIKVLDFGISKSPVGVDMRLTQTQSLLGTPAYMSPEQMRSARLVDARSDIWSLGTVLYELLEGRLPFEADSFSELCVKVAVDAPSAMTATPVGLQPVVLRCLAKLPDLRYPSMADLARDLVPFAQDPHQAQRLVERMQRTLQRSSASSDSLPRVYLTTPPSLPAEPAPVELADTEAARPPPSPPRTRRWRAAAVVGAVALLGLGLGLAGSVLRAGDRDAALPIAPAHAAPSPSPGAPIERAPAIAEPRGDSRTMSDRDARAAPAAGPGDARAAAASTSPGDPRAVVAPPARKPQRTVAKPKDAPKPPPPPETTAPKQPNCDPFDRMRPDADCGSGSAR